MPRLRAGDVVRVDFRGTEGSEPDKVRWSIVVDSGWIGSLDTVFLEPCTTQLDRRAQPTCVFVPAGSGALPEDSVATCHLLFPASITRFETTAPIGRVDESIVHKIRVVLCDLLGISAETFPSEGD